MARLRHSPDAAVNLPPPPAGTPPTMDLSHELPLIATLSVGLGIAFITGFAAMRIGLPPLVGYLVAGVIVGPFTPGFVADSGIARELAEIGVILLMFGVGTHFSIRDLWSVRRIALPGAIVQIGVATALGAWLATAWWGWSIGGALVFGLSLSVASTVVMLRNLQDRGLVDSANGRIAVGWLVVEDLAMVLALILLPAFASHLGGTVEAPAATGTPLWYTISITFLKIAAFFGLTYAIGLRLFPWLSAALLKSGSRELITLFVTVLAISMAYGASVTFGVSFALGAFLAGVVVNEAGLTHRFSSQAEVLEHVFAVLFFVSVGMLFDPAVLVRQPLEVLVVLAIIMVGKSLAALAIVLAFRHPLSTALTVSASLAQIGEFSFILIGLGVSLGLMPAEGRDLVLAGALLSITLNPMVFRLAARFERRSAQAQADRLASIESAGATADLHDHVVLIGYGRVGRVIGKELHKAGQHFVVVERSRDIVERLRKRGIAVISGDAAIADLLSQAALDRARLLVLAIPNELEARRVFALARAVNPELAIAVRAQDDDELEHFRDQGATLVLLAENELGQAMSRFVLAHCAPPAP